jgi:hypothetical protein
MIAAQWAKNLVISSSDIDDITNHLLEKETPMTTRELALYLIEHRLQQERATLENRFRNARLYNPAETYAIGERVLFPKFNYATAEVVGLREGQNPAYGPFSVMQVVLDGETREFATQFTQEHALASNPGGLATAPEKDLQPAEILEASGIDIMGRLLEALRASKELKQVAGYWFPKDLVLDIDIGVLHLAEAVLDMNNGGPLTTEAIIEQIGGIGHNAALALQVFSLNLAMSQDKRFDEVGPAGKILWFLKRMEPPAVQTVPVWLQYRPIEFSDDLFTEDMLDIETELDDELTEDIDFNANISRVTTKIIYPHRRAGTIPLNAKTRLIFPNARTPRISVTLVDDTDGQRYNGWVVHEHRFVYGALEYYTKHRLPVGALLTIRRGDKEGEFVMSYPAHKARTEYIPIFTPSRDTVAFENKRRSIGAEYDPLLVLGVDDLEAIDALAKNFQNKSLLTIMRTLIHELSKLSPQGTVHFVTLYSAVNVLRRCPPGPILAILQANADFEDMGNSYWRLASNER